MIRASLCGRRASLVAGLVAALVLAGGCIRDVGELPPPPPTSSTTTTTGPPDFSDAPLDAVPGTTTTTVVLGPGGATLNGIVTAADGAAVPGARVRVERLVGEGVASATVATGPDGKWAVAAILGGRYRVRSWRAPDLALITPVPLFVEAAQTVDVTLRLDRYRGLVAVPAIAPDPPVVHEPANLVVQIASRRVSEEGVVIDDPVPDVRLELSGGSAWQVTSSNPTNADSGGRGRWEVRCMEAGRQALSVVVAGEEAIALSVSDCALTPPTSTSAPNGSTTTTRGTTTTTRSTTTTTRGSPTGTSGSTTTTTTRSTTTTTRR